jgi:DNA-binding response OmpR family regulator
VILLQFANGDSNATAFVKAIRRHSDAAFRQVPIIAYMSNPTMSNFLAAKNCGVHEFMAKPFSARDVERRVDHVVNKPSDWISTTNYVGPDRRRFNSSELTVGRRRTTDAIGSNK